MSEFIQLPCFPDLQSALTVLSDVIGNKAGKSGIVHGLPIANGRLDPVYAGKAAQRAGLLLKKQDVVSAKSVHCPLLLVHANGSAVVVSAIKPGGLAQAVSSTGEAVTVLIAELRRRGFLLCWSVLPDDDQDARAAEIGANDHRRHWILNSLWLSNDVLPSVIAATVAINILALAIPLITMNILDRVVAHSAFETLWALAIGGSIALAGDFVLRNLRGILIDKASARSDVMVLNKIFANVLGARLPKKGSSVGVQSNTLREFESVREVGNSATITAIGDLPFAVLFLFVIFLVSGPLVLVPIGIVPLLLFAGLKTQGKLHQLVTTQFKDTAVKNAVAVELLSNLETIKVHAAESWAAAKWERAVASHLRHSLAMRWEISLGTNLILVLQGVTTIAVLVAGVYLISAGQISVGALFAASLLTGRSLTPVVQIALLFSKVHHAKIAYSSIRNLVDVEQERPDGSRFIACKDRFSILSLDRVSVTYGVNETPALKDVSLQIREGERIGIIGGIGSGKSTLLRAILGLQPPDLGTIALDGVPIRQLEPSSYRRKFGVAMREAGFFFGSIRENLLFHLPKASDEELIEAARAGCALEWVRGLPRGFDSPVGEGGIGLSTGQKQTLALSRALVGSPEILLFDEPTSDLDSKTEARFVSGLRNLPPQKTLIIVTHRPALIEACTRLIVVDKGGIMMDGDKALIIARLSQLVQAERVQGAVG